MVLLIQPIVLTNALAGTQEILDALTSALSTGNSARFVRGIILPGVILFMWSAYSMYDRIARKSQFLTRNRELIICAGVGVISGFAFVWSNDYGISCWVCLFIMTIWVSICHNQKILKVLLYAGVELIASAVMVFVAVEIFTAGHFSGWFSATFGTGGYQSWYYNSSKSYYLYDGILHSVCYRIAKSTANH